MHTFSVKFDPTDKYIAAGCGDGTIRIFNVFTGEQSCILNTATEEPIPTIKVRWCPPVGSGATENILISVNWNGALQHWDTKSGKLLNTLYDKSNELLSVDCQPDGTAFATGGTGQVVQVYDQSSLKLKLSLDGKDNGLSGHNNRINTIKFNKEDPNMLISGGWDRTVKVWDIRQPSPIRELFDPFISGDSLDLHQGYILAGSARTER